MTDRSTEAEEILALAGSDRLRAFQLVESQLNVLVLRTQVILSLSGIVITVTGFSGRAIAETSHVAQGCIVSGLIVVLLAAVVAVSGVLRLRWLTQVLGGSDALAMIDRMLVLRDAKARSLSIALVLFVVGFSLYCLAVAQLLIAA